MLKLNIISAELKKEIKLIIIYKFLKRLSFLIFSVLLIYSVAFQASRLILKKYSNDDINKKTVNTKNSDEYIQKVKDINEKINDVTTVQADSVNWSTFIKNFSGIVSNDISINQFSIDKKSSTLTISGTAITRDSLLGLESSLEKMTYLKEVNLPISDLLKKDNISFTIVAKFSNYEF